MALALFPEKVSSFTVKFPGVQQDESQVSGNAAACMDTRHHELPLGDFSLNVEAIERLIQHFDQPFADSSLIPTFL
ncbi:MAG: asparagine synthase-related protein, partial [Saprospiraceae bacterium]